MSFRRTHDGAGSSSRGRRGGWASHGWRGEQASKQSSFTANRRLRALRDEDDSSSDRGFLAQGRAPSSSKHSVSGRLGVGNFERPVVVHRQHGQSSGLARKRVQSGITSVSSSSGGFFLSHGQMLSTGEDADDEDDEDEIFLVGHSNSRKDVARPNVPRVHGRARLATMSSRRVTPPEVIVISDASESDVDPPAANSQAPDVPRLALALSQLDLKSNILQAHGRLPFLRRNLQKGFKRWCEMNKIPVEVKPSTLPVEIRYQYFTESGSDSSDSSSEPEEQHGVMASWYCPLCNIHGLFPSREMLKYHLIRDHSKVESIWEQDYHPAQFSWKLTLKLRSSLSPSSSSDFDQHEALSGKEEVVQTDTTIAGQVQESFNSVTSPVDPSAPLIPNILSGQHGAVPTSAPLEVALDPTTSTIAAVSLEARPPSPPVKIEHKFLRRSVSPALPATTSARVALVSSNLHSSHYRGSLPEQYPDPPPPSNRLGPAAQYPYLPDEQYSCRPGGPRLFDLLNTLSLEPFGVLSWMIVDREEEIYELDDVRDEDKVMLALWNRWIFLNRRKFAFEGQLKGVTAFIDQYWETIHRAAGWSSLRTFLLMLMVNKYLTVNDVAKMLKHYEGKTGMDLWYKD